MKAMVNNRQPVSEDSTATAIEVHVSRSIILQGCRTQFGGNRSEYIGGTGID